MRNCNSIKNDYEFIKRDTLPAELHRDRSLDIIQRNYLSMSNPNFDNQNSLDPSPVYKKLSYLNDENKKALSNYMDPIGQYNNYKIKRDNVSNSPILSNSGTYSLQKEKNFNKNIAESFTTLSEKSSAKSPQGKEILPNRLNLEGNNKCFRNNVLLQNSLENKKESNDPYFKHHVSEISIQSPKWFKVNDETKKKEIDNYYVQNNQSLHILSKFRDWITVTPKSKNRRKPLEKEKLTSLENSKICPLWMQINPTAKIPVDQFIPIQYASMSDNIKKTILVDKNQKY